MLPLENFDNTSLLSIDNAIGRVVKVDRNTVTEEKGRYTRVCMELSLNTPLPPNVMVWGRKQLVEYEGDMLQMWMPWSQNGAMWIRREHRCIGEV